MTRIPRSSLLSLFVRCPVWSRPRGAAALAALFLALALLARAPSAWAQQQGDDGGNGPSMVAPTPPAGGDRGLELFPDRPGSLLPLLGQSDPGMGGTPRPSPEIQAKYQSYVGQFIDPENTLDLVVGRPRILLLKRAPVRIQIPDERVASYQLISDRELSLTGQLPGATLLNFWFPDPNDATRLVILSYLVRVFPDPEAKLRLENVYQTLENDINRAFPNSRISLSLVGDSLLVRGQAHDSLEAGRIIQVVRSNAVKVMGAADVPTDETATVGGNAARNSAAATGASRLPGLEAFRLGNVARAPRSGGGGANVVNLIRVPGEPQIMLRVMVAEVNRSAARSIGLNFNLDTAQESFSPFNIALALFSGGSMILDNGQVQLALQALRNLNLAKSLAEPNLVTLNGQSANFQAGGEFPVPIVTGATATGLQGVTFVDFGVGVTFTPTIIDRDLIRLDISANVSSRSPELGANIGGTTVSGLTTRNFQTNVELRAGQTLAVAGLIQTTYGSNSTRTPGIGDIFPMLGNNSNSANEQELIMLVNVELVHPLDPPQVAALPGQDIFEPDDIEFYLLGRMESRQKADYRSSVRTSLDQMTLPRQTNSVPPVSQLSPEQAKRYEKLEQSYIIGPSGYSESPDR